MDQDKLLHIYDSIHNSFNPLHLKFHALTDQGLVSNEIRAKAWPIILASGKKPWRVKDFESIKDVNIVKCDVERSVFGSDFADQLSEEEREKRRKELYEIVCTVIKKNPGLYYVQGFNYIVCVFLLAAGFDEAYGLSEKCAQFFIRDYLRKDFNDGVIPYLKLVYSILDLVDQDVSDKLKSVYTFDDELMVPNVILPWIICWFSSTFYKFDDICRIFDFCLATHPLAPLYLAAVAICQKKDDLMMADDMSDVHATLRAVDLFDVDELCRKGFELMMKVPPLDLAQKSKGMFKEDSSVLNANGFEMILKRKKMEKVFGYCLFGAAFTTSIVLFIKKFN